MLRSLIGVLFISLSFVVTAGAQVAPRPSYDDDPTAAPAARRLTDAGTPPAPALAIPGEDTVGPAPAQAEPEPATPPPPSAGSTGGSGSPVTTGASRWDKTKSWVSDLFGGSGNQPGGGGGGTSSSGFFWAIILAALGHASLRWGDKKLPGGPPLLGRLLGLVLKPEHRWFATGMAMGLGALGITVVQGGLHFGTSLAGLVMPILWSWPQGTNKSGIISKLDDVLVIGFGLAGWMGAAALHAAIGALPTWAVPDFINWLLPHPHWWGTFLVWCVFGGGVMKHVAAFDDKEGRRTLTKWALLGAQMLTR